MEPSDSNERGRAGYGAFKGVFTPSLLTILGVILYLRMGWVVGHAGLVGALLIITLASSVTFLTGLSIAATATNMRVGVGGAYFMISRSLGLRAGAAVGLPLYLAQALGVAFYLVGFAEAVSAFVPDIDARVLGVAALVGIGVLAWISSELVLRAHYVILTLIAASLVSFFLGGPPVDGFAPVGPTPDVGFWIVFAVFFPAVTGIEAGVSLSGDLREPSKALPRGTVAAVLVGYAVYVCAALVLSRWVPADVLRADSLVMQRLALFGPLIMAGLCGATLSSALGALLGAPRTLQALAHDRVLPRALAKLSGRRQEPRVATGITLAIALTGIVLGDLNAIAPVLSMFFLTSYFTLNLSAGLEGLLGSPSWRPQVRTPWVLSLAGAAICIIAMVMISAGAAILAGVISGGVYYLAGRRDVKAYWGDLRQGLFTLLAWWAIHRLAGQRPDPHSWRPHILVLSPSPAQQPQLIALAHALVHHLGFLSVGCVVPTDSSVARDTVETERAIEGHLARRGISALVQVHASDDDTEGVLALMQASGLGPLRPNTFVLAAPESDEGADALAQVVLLAAHRKKNVLFLRAPKDADPNYRSVDVWWGGRKRNQGLMVALAYLLQTSAGRVHPKLVIRTVVGHPDEKTNAEERLRALVQEGRLEATAEVELAPGKDPFSVIVERSSHADLTLVGLRPPDDGETPEAWAAYLQDLLERTSGLHAAAFVLAAEEIEFERIFT